MNNEKKLANDFANAIKQGTDAMGVPTFITIPEYEELDNEFKEKLKDECAKYNLIIDKIENTPFHTEGRNKVIAFKIDAVLPPISSYFKN